jgi:hypothetical protein
MRKSNTNPLAEGRIYVHVSIDVRFVFLAQLTRGAPKRSRRSGMRASSLRFALSGEVKGKQCPLLHRIQSISAKVVNLVAR